MQVFIIAVFQRAVTDSPQTLGSETYGCDNHWTNRISNFWIHNFITARLFQNQNISNKFLEYIAEL